MVLSLEDQVAVTIIDFQLNEGIPEGQGIGTRFMGQAKAYCDQHGKQLVASNVSAAKGFYDQLGFMQYVPSRQFASDQYVYDPNEGLGTESAARICPTCGDPLAGLHGTFCPRCQWSEMDANLDSDPLSNPPDPTRDLHKGIQAGRKQSDKLHDFLLNPKSRPDLQTPEGQAFLRDLERNYHNEKTDALMPWLTREWKKGRLLHTKSRGLQWPGEVANAASDVPILDWPTLGPSRVNHWADFLQSNHPVRRQLGDIMKHDIGSLHSQTQAWDEAMASEAHEKSLQGGNVVHTTPDNWTVRQLTTPEELTAEGDAMGHCLGGYYPSVENGRSLIYSLRDPKGAPHATTEIRPEQYEWTDSFGKTHRSDSQSFDDSGPISHPIPHGGEVVQIQGKGNQEPIDEHKARLADWFRSFPPEERPVKDDSNDEVSMWDENGYSHHTLDHPDLIPQYQREFGQLAPSIEPTEDEYGLLHRPASMPSDYDELLKNIYMREVDWGTTRGDSAHIKSIYLLAKERGEIPELAQALGAYEEDQQEDFDNWMELNWQHVPRHVDPDEPHGWEDEEGTNVDEGEGKPYWEPEGPADIGAVRHNDPDKAEEAYDRAYGQLASQHGGLDTANEMYKRILPHYGPHPETGEQGYWNQPALPEPEAPVTAPAAPQAFSSVIPSHRYARWLDAVEDAP